jgi:hypothetical protein
MRLGKATRSLLAATLIATAAAVPAAVTAGAAQPDLAPRPLSSFAGKSAAEWTAAWWQWMVAIAEPNSPFTDTTGADCNVGQTQPVFFLAGGPGSTFVNRACTVPNDKALLIPAINSECSSTPGDCGAPSTNYTVLRKAAGSAFANGVTTSIRVDGVELRVQHLITGPPPYPIDFAPGNPFGLVGSGVSVADGYYVLLAPLPAGDHTVDLIGSQLGYTTTVHYDLHVGS